MAVTGQVIPVSLQAKSQFIFERYWGFNKGYIPTVFDKQYFTSHMHNGVPAWDIGAGANMAFRREIFDLAGFFDERLDVGAAGCSGDSEFWYRILAEGWNCFYCPQLFVYHQHRDSDKALQKQIFSYMRGHVAALLVQYENYGHEGNIRRLYKILPRYYLGFIKAMLLKGRTEGHHHLFSEIKGCISGWRFYQSVKTNKRIDVPAYNKTLSAPAVVTEDTLVSVIITCYNYGRYLKQAIDSVVSQTYKNIEIIVVDDGSTDNTQEVIRNCPGVKSVTVHRVGASAARNIGVQFSSGSLLVFLDADDYLYPDAIEVNRSYYREFPTCAFISGAHDRVTNAGEILATPDQQQHFGNNYQMLLQGNYIGVLGNTMYRRDLFFAFHFDTTLGNCEEYDLNLHISKYFPSFSHKHKLIAYRVHENNKSGNKEQMYATIKRILSKHRAMTENSEVKKAIEQGLKNWGNFYLKS
jgi:GT2 family glycosyltransferase